MAAIPCLDDERTPPMTPLGLVTSMLALLLALVLMSNPAPAGEWKFKVVNKGNLPAIEFRTKEDDEWSSNWISERVEPGDTFDMDFGSDKGDCTVRTQIRFTDGSYFDANVNYCNVSTLYIHDNRLTAD
jgi:hypothetical protein